METRPRLDDETIMQSLVCERRHCFVKEFCRGLRTASLCLICIIFTFLPKDASETPPFLLYLLLLDFILVVVTMTEPNVTLESSLLGPEQSSGSAQGQSLRTATKFLATDIRASQSAKYVSLTQRPQHSKQPLLGQLQQGQSQETFEAL